MQKNQRLVLKNGNKNRVFMSYLKTFILAVVAFIQLYPLIYLLLFSLKSNDEIFGGNPLGFPKQFLWGNYQQAINNGQIGRYFINSLIVTAVSIIVSNILICMAAYSIARLKWKMSGTVLTTFLLGLMIPAQAALLPLFIILRNLKMLNSYWALIIPYVAFALPMGIFIMVGFFATIPKEMEESAVIDGCNIYQAFFYIILPLVKSAIVTISIFTYLGCWNELMFAVTFINNDNLKTLPIGITNLVGQYSTDWGPIGAGLVIATLPSVLIYVLLSSNVQKSFTSGAIKG